MNAPLIQAAAPDTATGAILKLAVMAVGGQGGGVLAGWIETLARSQGHACQATSVAGVAQRTGATIYYIEMTPDRGGAPVFALAPAAGDVDILIAAEMMEAGRAILRGFVTPDRTVLIGSTHRALAVSEKTMPGDGIADAGEVRAAAELAARRLILADMEALAREAGSVISASLFGALAGSGALPFERAAFEAAIRAGGKGIEPSLRAFAAGFDAVAAPRAPAAEPAPARAAPAVSGPADALADWQALAARVAAMPPPVAAIALAGLRKVVDFQDPAYGAAYLDRLGAVLACDEDGRGHVLSVEAARHIANAMAYDDIIRVADLKTRPARFARIRTEMAAGAEHGLHLTEYLHPRAEEVAGMLPAGWGAWLEARPARLARLDRWVNRGRRLRSDALPGFAILHLLGGLRRYRLRTRRHAVEMAHLENWLARALVARARDYDLAVEILRCRRLIKGYSDTHARGLSKFDRVMEGVEALAGRADAAEWVRRLREAALQDAEGKTLDGALATVRSFV